MLNKCASIRNQTAHSAPNVLINFHNLLDTGGLLQAHASRSVWTNNIPIPQEED
jgi:hypothetical protein